MKKIIAFFLVLFLAIQAPSYAVFQPYAQPILNTTFPVPDSSSTILVFGDSLAACRYGPTSCVSAANAPASVAPASCTGTGWPDLICAFYGAHIVNLAVGGSPLTNVGPAGDGAGILRYNASYVCPAQSTSPTSGLQNNCNAGTYPALDSFCGPNVFPVMGYFGHNDNFYNWANVDYVTYSSNLETIDNDLIAHGCPANQFIFLGSFKGGRGSSTNQYSYSDLLTTMANAVEAARIGGRFVDVMTPLSTNVLNSNSSSVFYDSIHPNDATNCIGVGCLGGSEVIAAAIEAPPAIPAAMYAAAYGVMGAMGINLGIPFFDTNGDLSLPSGSSIIMGSSTLGANSIQENGNINIIPANNCYQGGSNPMLCFDTANTVIKAATGGGTVVFQKADGTNVMWFSSGGQFQMLSTAGMDLDHGSIINIDTMVTANGLYSDGGTVQAYPWHPASAPTCTIAAAGTTCTTGNISMPHSTMVCSANVQGTSPPAGVVGEVDVSAPGSTETITYTLSSAWVAGGTITFNMTCD